MSTKTANPTEEKDESQTSQVKAFIGMQWGDEGKGQAVYEAATKGYEEGEAAVIRFQGGANAGHTVYIPVDGENEDYKKVINHTKPSADPRKNDLYLGKDMVLDPYKFAKEIEDTAEALEMSERDLLKSINVAERIHVTFPEYYIEELQGIAQKDIGSTARGIGPTAKAKAERSGNTIEETLYKHNRGEVMDRVRESLKKMDQKVGDSSETLYKILKRKWDLPDDMSFEEFFEDYTKYFVKGLEMFSDSRVDLINFENDKNFYEAMKEKGKDIVVEGAQGTLLSYKDGAYPYVTSTDPTVNGIPAGTEIPLDAIDEVTGVFKAYMTKVGGGPMYTQIDKNPLTVDLDPTIIRDVIVYRGEEFGATTGRPRNPGHLDKIALISAINSNKLEKADFNLRMVKADVLGGLPEIDIGEGYVLEGENPELRELLLNESSGVEMKDGKIHLNKFPSLAIEDKHLKPKLTPISEIEGIEGPWDDVNWDKVGIEGQDEAPDELEDFIEYLEGEVGVPISQVSIGPKGHQTYQR